MNYAHRLTGIQAEPSCANALLSESSLVLSVLCSNPHAHVHALIQYEARVRVVCF